MFVISFGQNQTVSTCCRRLSSSPAGQDADVCCTFTMTPRTGLLGRRVPLFERSLHHLPRPPTTSDVACGRAQHCACSVQLKGRHSLRKGKPSFDTKYRHFRPRRYSPTLYAHVCSVSTRRGECSIINEPGGHSLAGAKVESSFT